MRGASKFLENGPISELDYTEPKFTNSVLLWWFKQWPPINRFTSPHPLALFPWKVNQTLTLPCPILSFPFLMASASVVWPRLAWNLRSFYLGSLVKEHVPFNLLTSNQWVFCRPQYLQVVIKAMNIIPPTPKISAITKFHLAYYALIRPTNGEGVQSSSQKWGETFLQETGARLTYGCDTIHYILHSLSLSIKINAQPRGHCVLWETASPEEKH